MGELLGSLGVDFGGADFRVSVLGACPWGVTLKGSIRVSLEL